MAQCKLNSQVKGYRHDTPSFHFEVVYWVCAQRYFRSQDAQFKKLRLRGQESISRDASLNGIVQLYTAIEHRWGNHPNTQYLDSRVPHSYIVFEAVTPEIADRVSRQSETTWRG